jgi:hypothetical protein
MEKMNKINDHKKNRFLRIKFSRILIHPVSFNHNLKIVSRKNKLEMKIVIQIKKIVHINFNLSNNLSKT